MRRPSSFSILAQVAALAALAVIMSQAIAFAVVILAPEPPPAGFTIDAAASALKGETARTTDGRALRSRITNQPARRSDEDAADPVALALTAVLAERLDVAPERVRVSVDHGERRRGPPTERERGPMNMVFVSPSPPPPPKAPAPPAPPPPPAPPARDQVETAIRRHHATDPAETRFTIRRAEGAEAVVLDTRVRQFTVLADRLTFAPFAASVLQSDGRWATVEPPRDLLSPWQKRVLIALAISMLLLAPLVWWMARRLTRPIRVFADAAERLGADPDAAPLTPSGPSEVRTAIQAFNDMQASLRDHMRKRTQTVAAIAHDLRTPLTRLRFRAEQAPAVVRDRMAADIEEMDALIAQAMAYVRGEATPERRERFDLAALAADCAGGFSETGAAVTFDGGGDLPVEADPAALRRGLGNLIANAVKYGGSARVTAFAGAGRAVVLIEDDGPGLADDQTEAVFEPFHRGERSRSRETGGAGLGLTVARQAARAHGGDVTLTNRSAGGLTARLELPLSTPTTETP